MQSTLNKTLILCWQAPSAADDHAKMIVEFMGAEADVVSGERQAGALDKLITKYSALIVSATTLCKIAEKKTGIGGLASLLQSNSHIFVYGFDSAGRHDEMLKSISDGQLGGVQPIASDAAFQVSAKHRDACRQFSGLGVSEANHSRDLGFIRSGNGTGYETLISADDQPFFVRFRDGNAAISVVACREIADLGEQVSCEAGLLPWFSRLVPLMIFLRSAFGTQLWHSDSSQACFIIDDPLLKQKYGFLEYRKLLEIMGRERFSACIAFIPWNYRRSALDIAGKFSTGAGSLSMCVHGCDHTAAEFATTESQALINKGQIALERMQEHARHHKVPFDDVMVFPQGLFSSEALKALDACGYLAAINTDLCPSNARSVMTLRDLLEVSVTRFGLSLFWRHYPTDIAHFAFDLFLGKPAFVVEHHGYFRNGYQHAAEFMRKLNQLDDLQWQNPATICSRACLQRETADGKVQVRFYTNRFELINHSNRSQTYSLFRKWSANQPLPKVTFNRNEWLAKIMGEDLQIELTLLAGETAKVRILSGLAKTHGFRKETGSGQAKILVRRVLSEFRDDYVETNPLLRELVSGLRRLLASRKSKTQRQTVGIAGSVQQSGAR
jgi:hypothetical protein